MKKYIIADPSGVITDYAATAAEARRIMSRYTCPMTRYLSRELPDQCHRDRRIGGIVAELVARDSHWRVL